MSEIRANTISDAAGTGPVTLTGQYAAKAWVNFNGTGTVAIRESGNVTSITDNGTGNYTVNFTTALTDADYAVSGSAGRGTTAGAEVFIHTPTDGFAAGSIKIFVVTGTPSAVDASYVSISTHR
jgi:hypothetical protein